MVCVCVCVCERERERERKRERRRLTAGVLTVREGEGEEVAVQHFLKDLRALCIDIFLLFENTIACCALKLAEGR